eukprot:1236378-Alexandrium_andersonii.AAC.1
MERACRFASPAVAERERAREARTETTCTRGLISPRAFAAPVGARGRRWFAAAACPPWARIPATRIATCGPPAVAEHLRARGEDSETT